MDTKTVAVVGAGQMGQGIAQVSAQADYNAIIIDVDLKVAEAGRQKIKSRLDRAVEKGKLEKGEAESVFSRVSVKGSIEEAAQADILIEAVTERFDIKQKILEQADKFLPASAIIASNTSSISLTKLAATTKRPEQVIGTHFMNPVPVMELLEIIRALQTSDATYETVCAMGRRLGKTLITSGDAPGFIVNRMLIPFLNEACFVLQEGLGTVEDIDAGARLGLNHPMGPLQLADFVGLDTCLYIAEILHRELGDDKYRPAQILRNYVAAGWYGKKTGRGFYDYRDGDPKAPRRR